MSGPIVLTPEQAAEIAEEIDRGMFHYSYNSHGSDYSCIFCFEEMPPNGAIVHRDGCSGKRCLKHLGVER